MSHKLPLFGTPPSILDRTIQFDSRLSLHSLDLDLNKMLDGPHQ